MGYGKLLGKQEDAVKALVQGKDVCDLGAGDMELSVKLLELGATKIIAVDKEDYPVPDPRIVRILSYFNNVWRHTRPPKIAFISWPINHADPSLARLVDRFPFIAYLGKNTDMTSCATPGFFQPLLRREVMAYIPNRKNVLIIYGPNSVEREPYGEELAAITAYEKAWYYEEAEAEARRLQSGR
jgi:hypothetical protein